MESRDGDMPPAWPREAILSELERISSSQTFHGSSRATKLLRYIVEQTVSGQRASLKEYTIATEALGKSSSLRSASRSHRAR